MAKKYFISDFLKRFKRPFELEVEKDYKLVTISSKHRGIKLRHLKKGGLIKSKMYEVKEGDFVLSGIDARNGAFGIIPKELDGAIITNDFWCLEINEDIISKELFLELTATTWFDELCNRGSDGTTNRVRLQKNKFFNQEVVLPLKKEQDDLLNKVLGIKNNTFILSNEIQTQKQLLTQLKQSILQEAIQGKLTADWRKQNPNTEPAIDLLKRIKAEKAQLIKDKKIKKENPLPPITEDKIPFEIPESWVWCRLGEIGFTQTGTTPPKNDSSNYGDFIPFIQPSNISRNGLNFNCISLTEKGLLKSRHIQKHSNLMVCIGGSAGKTCYNEVDIACNQQINTITGFNGIFYKYLDAVLNSPHFQALVWSKIKQGSTPILNKGRWCEIVVPICNNEEQKAIVEKVEILMQKCNALEQEITQSEQNAQMLMQAVLKEAFERKQELVEV